MWFSFGLVSLLVIFIYRLYTRINASWSGETATANGLAYEYKKRKYKQHMQRLLIGICVPDTYDFHLKKENSIDKFFKRLGLSKEYQSGHIIFDDMIYIASDNAHFHNLTSQSSKAVNAIVEIFRKIERYDCKPVEIIHNSGKLWVELKTPQGMDEDKIFDFMPAIVEQLNIIHHEIEKAKTNTSTSSRDHFRIKAAFLLAISSGLAINGGLQLFRINLGELPYTVDLTALIWHAIAIGVAVSVALLILARFLLDGSARTHLVMLDILLTGTFGTCSTALAEMRDINMEMDRSRPALYASYVIDMHINHSRRSGTTYRLYIPDWNGGNTTQSIKVSSTLYYSLQKGDAVRISQKTGYLNYHWVEDIRKNDRISSE